MKVIFKRLMSAAVVVLFSTAFASAQLTTAEPFAGKVKGGNRAKAGNFGLYMGVTSDMFSGWADSEVSVSALPLINLKYMVSDRFEARLGLEFYKQKDKVSSEVSVEDNAVLASTSKVVNSKNYLYPGVAYHFAPKNILDIYVGAELPIGWCRDLNAAEAGKTSMSVKKTTFDIGVGAFVGLQAYIADLPLALGVEYGLAAMLNAGLRYENTVVDSEGKRSVYYTDVAGEGHYDEYKASRSNIGSQFRLTFTYYFGK